MRKDTYKLIFERELLQLKKELDSYEDEAGLWKLTDGINNSAGNLALHLIGNLNHFIGEGLGHTGYIRKREEEFTKKDIALSEINRDIDNTIDMLKKVFENITDKDLDADHTMKINDTLQSVDLMLMHLLGHLSYHLGQINYHRRLVN